MHDSNADEFIKFANRLMNDVTFMLDELLSKLAEIKRLQLEMARKEEWDALSQEEREDKQTKLRSSEGLVESWTIYSREFLSLLIEFTGSSKAPFVSGEIVGRLTAMLDYVLVQLAGPRCADLKTKDMDKYGFDPRELLGKVLQIYINLSTEASFIQGIAMEGRSYSKEVFDRALSIARDKLLKTPEELEIFAGLTEKVEQMRAAMDEEEIDTFPDEFEGMHSIYFVCAPLFHKH
jgi:ubiquitin conjugation factor E4 B